VPYRDRNHTTDATDRACRSRSRKTSYQPRRVVAKITARPRKERKRIARRTARTHRRQSHSIGIAVAEKTIRPTACPKQPVGSFTPASAI
jgi:hypothetical protein